MGLTRFELSSRWTLSSWSSVTCSLTRAMSRVCLSRVLCLCSSVSSPLRTQKGELAIKMMFLNPRASLAKNLSPWSRPPSVSIFLLMISALEPRSAWGSGWCRYSKRIVACTCMEGAVTPSLLITLKLPVRIRCRSCRTVYLARKWGRFTSPSTRALINVARTWTSALV